MDSMIEIDAIDNDRMLLEAMSAWIATTDDIRLVETASSVDSYLALSRRAKIVLLDLNLDDFTDPVANVEKLVATGSKVVVMSVIPDKAYVVATTRAGALAYVTKDNNLALFADVIRMVATGEPAMTTEHAFWLSQDDHPRRPRLSPQEARILALYASGMTLVAAARRAGISYATARSYLERVRVKYAEAGRPITHRVEYSDRVREDRLGREVFGASSLRGDNDTEPEAYPSAD